MDTGRLARHRVAAAVRHRSHPARRSGLVTSRRSRQAVAAGVGVALAAVYVATVFLAGSRDLLVRRPLLDGFITPQPYNWVRPPAALST